MATNLDAEAQMLLEESHVQFAEQSVARDVPLFSRVASDEMA
jgi:hypothetical protein